MGSCLAPVPCKSPPASGGQTGLSHLRKPSALQEAGPFQRSTGLGPIGSWIRVMGFQRSCYFGEACATLPQVPYRCPNSNQVLSMLKYRTPYSGSLQSRSRAYWLAAWLLVVFYLVASGRAFVPGICATQWAMDARQARDLAAPSLHAPRGCCILPRAGSGESKEPVVPENSGCALCKLVSTAAPLAATVHVPAPPAHEFATPRAREAQCTGLFLDRPLQPRAPPRITHLS